ncbi:phage shock protein B [Cricetibacter osteomyelitidis]|uniref:Phage shock protein B n=1 Tax=Cricetibacter osteomyelitidis TaxID=1521931 RepID=A0A4R2SUJ5_9PAST|nr:envelope stress response membrane protein PspB [Cricetibacter osteomyelitidis]TCP92166.1 phage shock protein B [Cricetibacter osteomyelitidis]
MFTSFLLLSICAFIVALIAVPLWLYLNYKSKQDFALGLTQEEKQQITELENETKQLSQRITQLEALLDYHKPNWRETR